VLSGLLDLGDIAPIGAVHRVHFGQQTEGEDHVVRRDRMPVVETRFRPQIEGGPGPVFRHFDALGHQSVLGEFLVGGRGHQRVIDQAGTRRGHAADSEGVQIVEGAERALGEAAALGGVGVDIVEMGEVRAVFRLAMHGEAVAARGFRGLGLGNLRPGRRGHAGHERDQQQGRKPIYPEHRRPTLHDEPSVSRGIAETASSAFRFGASTRGNGGIIGSAAALCSEVRYR
jgi:hypothetical protein